MEGGREPTSDSSFLNRQTETKAFLSPLTQTLSSELMEININFLALVRQRQPSTPGAAEGVGNQTMLVQRGGTEIAKFLGFSFSKFHLYKGDYCWVNWF